MNTRSVFYYDFTVDETSNTLRVNEGAADIDITLPTGRYALSNYIEMVSVALNDTLTNEYIVSVDRNTRLITISSTVSFSLLVADIFPLNSGYPVMGFTGANLIGSTSYTGNIASGKAYYPQMKLQDYIDFEHNKEYINGTIKESASGNVEVVSFGLKEYAEFNLKWSTSKNVGEGNAIENNPTGYEDLVDFMNYLITKGELEFIKDRDNRNTYSVVMLEKTASNNKGIGYTLKENFQALGFYETGKLKFRKL